MAFKQVFAASQSPWKRVPSYEKELARFATVIPFLISNKIIGINSSTWLDIICTPTTNLDLLSATILNISTSETIEFLVKRDFSVDYCNAIPIPIDVNKDTWQLNPELLEKKITKKTKLENRIKLKS